MPQLVKAICGVCKGPCYWVGWTANETFDENDPLELQSTAELCDAGDSDGCFKNYHKECFSKHRCPVYDGEYK